MLLTCFTKIWYAYLVVKFFIWDEGISLLWDKREVIDIKKMRTTNNSDKKIMDNKEQNFSVKKA